MPVILFVKARRPSHATLSLVTPDLFGNLEEREVQHRGFVDSHGHYHAPHVQTHHVAVDQPKEQPVKAPTVEAKPAPAPKATAQPAPEPAKPAASVHPDIEAMIASLALDPSNTNAKAVDRKLEIMRELVGKGDPQAIRDANWGTNTYGKRIARKAAEIADRMEVHEVMDVVEAHHADVAEVQEGAEPGDGRTAVSISDNAVGGDVAGGGSREQKAAEDKPRGLKVEPNLPAMAKLFDSLRAQMIKQGYWRDMDDAADALSQAVPRGTMNNGSTSLLIELEHGGKIHDGAMMRIMSGPGRDIIDLVARLDAAQDQSQLTARNTINAWGREGHENKGPQEGDIKTEKGLTGDDGTGKVYLSVPSSKREYAKLRGARWDSARRQWYVVGSVPDALKKFMKSMVVLSIPSLLGNRNGF